MTSDPESRPRLTGVSRATIVVTAIYVLGIAMLIFAKNWTPLLPILIPLLLIAIVAVIVLAVVAGSGGGRNRVTGVVCGCVLLLPILIVVVLNLIAVPR